MSFPAMRLRRLRQKEAIRRLVQESCLAANDLVYPIFLKEGIRQKKAISSMPGQYQHTLQSAMIEVGHCKSLGIPAVLLFGIPKVKNLDGSGAYSDNGIVQQFIAKAKKKFPDLVFIADVCLCEYTSHGHCGHMMGKIIDNDTSLHTLSQSAVSMAKAGADIVAPSDMMDGRIGAIRKALDEEGYSDTLILSYAAKFASAYYGPFRDAAENKPQAGNRLTYQMNPANAFEAIREVELDLNEGADMILLKPGMNYLDVVKDVRNKTHVPLGVYNVSGEYSMIKAASSKKWIDEKALVLESLLCMKRAGANFIITYWAKQVAKWL